MSAPLKSFDKNIESIKMLDNIYKYFSNQLHAIDLSEILRAELVLLVSAFDCYIHDIVKYGMLEIFDGKRESNTKFSDFRIPMSYVQQIILSEDISQKKQLIEAAIKNVNSKNSFQSPSNIDNTLQIISVKNIWGQIKDDVEMEPSDIKNKLGVIVNRRNKIAHEADINSITDEKTEIQHEDIVDNMEFISKVAYAIDRKLFTVPPLSHD